MSSDDPHPPASPADDPDDRLDHLEAAIEELRAQLQRVRAQLSAEVRTRRVVIVEGDDFERVVLDAAGHFGALTVHARAGKPGSVGVEVFAADARGGDRAHVGVALLDGGDVVAAVDVQAGRPAMVWTPNGGGDDGSDSSPGSGRPESE